MAEDKTFDLTKGPIWRHVMRMLLPFSLAVLSLMSAGLIDTMYLGNMSDEARPDLGIWALAAVGLAYPLTFLGNSANIGLGAGTMSAVSRAVGRADMEQARRHGAAAIIFAFIVMSIMTAAMLISIPFLLPLFNAEPQVVDMAQKYLFISVPGLAIVSIPMMCNNVLRAHGEALVPSSIMILGAFINIILDPFLIFGWGPFPRLEIQGAALATVTGNIIAAIYGIYWAVFRRFAIDFKQMTMNSFRSASRIIGSVGIPAAMTNIVVPVGTTLSVYIISTNLTTKDLAAFTMTSRAELISVGLLYALSACIGAITGQNGGAGKTQRVRQTFKTCFLICIVWSTLMAAVLAIFAEPISGIFTDDPELIALSAPYFRIVPITIAGYGFVFLSSAGLNALGRPQYGLIYTIIRSLILYVGFIYIGVMYDGLRGAYYGIAAANIVAGLIASGHTLFKAPMTVSKIK